LSRGGSGRGFSHALHRCGDKTLGFFGEPLIDKFVEMSVIERMHPCCQSLPRIPFEQPIAAGRLAREQARLSEGAID